VLLWDPIDTLQKQCLPTLLIRSVRQLSYHQSAIEVEGGGNNNYFKFDIIPLTLALYFYPMGTCQTQGILV
jgi:hypothetical protein